MFHNSCILYILQILFVIENKIEKLLFVGKIWQEKNNCFIKLMFLLASVNLTATYLNLRKNQLFE